MEIQRERSAKAKEKDITPAEQTVGPEGQVPESLKPEDFGLKPTAEAADETVKSKEVQDTSAAEESAEKENDPTAESAAKEQPALSTHLQSWYDESAKQGGLYAGLVDEIRAMEKEEYIEPKAPEQEFEADRVEAAELEHPIGTEAPVVEQFREETVPPDVPPLVYSFLSDDLAATAVVPASTTVFENILSDTQWDQLHQNVFIGSHERIFNHHMHLRRRKSYLHTLLEDWCATAENLNRERKTLSNILAESELLEALVWESQSMAETIQGECGDGLQLKHTFQHQKVEYKDDVVAIVESRWRSTFANFAQTVGTSEFRYYSMKHTIEAVLCQVMRSAHESDSGRSEGDGMEVPKGKFRTKEFEPMAENKAETELPEGLNGVIESIHDLLHMIEIVGIKTRSHRRRSSTTHRDGEESLIDKVLETMQRWVSDLFEQSRPLLSYDGHRLLLLCLLRSWSCSRLTKTILSFPSGRFRDEMTDYVLSVMGTLLTPLPRDQIWEERNVPELHQTPGLEAEIEDDLTEYEVVRDKVEDVRKTAQSMFQLDEDSYLAMLDQMPLNRLVVTLIEELDSHDPRRIINALGRCREIIELLALVLSHWPTGSYRFIRRRVTLNIQEILIVCATKSQEYDLSLEDKRGDLLSEDQRPLHRILFLESQNLLQMFVEVILASQSFGVWQTLVDLPYRLLSDDLAWQIFHEFHISANNNEAAAKRHQVRCAADWVRMHEEDTSLRTAFRDRLMLFHEDDGFHLLSSLAALGLSRVEDRHSMRRSPSDARSPQTSTLTEAVILEIFEICYKDRFARSKYYKVGRGLLRSMTSVYPRGLSCLLTEIVRHFDSMGAMATHLFTDLPLHYWTPDSHDFVNLEALLLSSAVSLSKLNAAKGVFARDLLLRLNWKWMSTEGGHHRPCIDSVSHQRVAIMVVKYLAKLAQSAVGGDASVTDMSSSGGISTYVSSLGYLVSTVTKPFAGQKTVDLKVIAWAWDLLLQLQLLPLDGHLDAPPGVDFYVEVRDGSPETVSSVDMYDPVVVDDNKNLPEMLTRVDPAIAAYVSLMLTPVGREYSVFAQSGALMLHEVLKCDREDVILRVVHDVVSRHIGNEKFRLLNNVEFGNWVVALFAKLEEVESSATMMPSLGQYMASYLSYGDAGRINRSATLPVGHQEREAAVEAEEMQALCNLIYSSILGPASKLDENSVSRLLFWVNAVMKVPNWTHNRMCQVVLNCITQVAFMYNNAYNTILGLLTNDYQRLLMANSSRGKGYIDQGLALSRKFVNIGGSYGRESALVDPLLLGPPQALLEGSSGENSDGLNERSTAGVLIDAEWVQKSYLGQMLNALKSIDHSSTSMLPYTVFTLLLTETIAERSMRLEVGRYLMKRPELAICDVSKQRDFNLYMNVEHMVIHDWSLAILNLPDDHDILPLFLQMWFCLYYESVEDVSRSMVVHHDDGGMNLANCYRFGLRILEGEPLRIVQRIKTKLRACIGAAERAIGQPLSKKRTSLYQAMLKWIEDDRLNARRQHVNLKQLGYEYDLAHLMTVLQPDSLKDMRQSLWRDYVDWSAVHKAVEARAVVMRSVVSPTEENEDLVQRDSDFVSRRLAAKTGKWVTEADEDDQREPEVIARHDFSRVLEDIEVAAADPLECQKLMRSVESQLDELGKTATRLTENQAGFFAALKNLYQESQETVVMQLRCDRDQLADGTHVDTEECSRPARLIFTKTAYTINSKEEGSLQHHREAILRYYRKGACSEVLARQTFLISEALRRTLDGDESKGHPLWAETVSYIRPRHRSVQFATNATQYVLAVPIMVNTTIGSVLMKQLKKGWMPIENSQALLMLLKEAKESREDYDYGSILSFADAMADEWSPLTGTWEKDAQTVYNHITADLTLVTQNILAKILRSFDAFYERRLTRPGPVCTEETAMAAFDALNRCTSGHQVVAMLQVLCHHIACMMRTYGLLLITRLFRMATTTVRYADPEEQGRGSDINSEFWLRLIEEWRPTIAEEPGTAHRLHQLIDSLHAPEEGQPIEKAQQRRNKCVNHLCGLGQALAVLMEDTFASEVRAKAQSADAFRSGAPDAMSMTEALWQFYCPWILSSELSMAAVDDLLPLVAAYLRSVAHIARLRLPGMELAMQHLIEIYICHRSAPYFPRLRPLLQDQAPWQYYPVSTKDMKQLLRILNHDDISVPAPGEQDFLLWANAMTDWRWDVLFHNDDGPEFVIAALKLLLTLNTEQTTEAISRVIDLIVDTGDLLALSSQEFNPLREICTFLANDCRTDPVASWNALYLMSRQLLAQRPGFAERVVCISLEMSLQTLRTAAQHSPDAALSLACAYADLLLYTEKVVVYMQQDERYAKGRVLISQRRIDLWCGLFRVVEDCYIHVQPNSTQQQILQATSNGSTSLSNTTVAAAASSVLGMGVNNSNLATTAPINAHQSPGEDFLLLIPLLSYLVQEHRQLMKGTSGNSINTRINASLSSTQLRLPWQYLGMCMERDHDLLQCLDILVYLSATYAEEQEENGFSSTASAPSLVNSSSLMASLFVILDDYMGDDFRPLELLRRAEGYGLYLACVVILAYCLHDLQHQGSSRARLGNNQVFELLTAVGDLIITWRPSKAVSRRHSMCEAVPLRTCFDQSLTVIPLLSAYVGLLQFQSEVTRIRSCLKGVQDHATWLTSSSSAQASMYGRLLSVVGYEQAPAVDNTVTVFVRLCALVCAYIRAYDAGFVPEDMTQAMTCKAEAAKMRQQVRDNSENRLPNHTQLMSALDEALDTRGGNLGRSVQFVHSVSRAMLGPLLWSVLDPIPSVLVEASSQVTRERTTSGESA
eukprot:Clim_evm8s241 gene=Clim_evmTU8s241